MPGLFVFEQRTEEYKVIKMTISLLTKSHSCVAKFFVFTCTLFVPYFSYTKQKSGWIARIFQLQTNATYFCKQSSFSYRLNTSEHRKNIKVYLLTKSSFVSFQSRRTRRKTTASIRWMRRKRASDWWAFRLFSFLNLLSVN